MSSPSPVLVALPTAEDRLRVLIIEDNEPDARLIARQLEGEPDGTVGVTWASDLAEGITLLREEGADVVLTDLGLPDSEGLQTVEALRRCDEELPIVVLTGWDDTDAATQAILSGAQDYLVKGEVEPRVLHRTLRYAIERKRIEDALRRSLDRLTRLDHERRRLLDLLIHAEEAERTRLAIELHDGPLQSLSALVLDLSRLRDRLDIEDPGAREILANDMSMLAEEIRTLREMMVELHPPVLDERGLEAALLTQTRRLAEADIACFIHPHVRVRPHPTVETVLYRVVQEAVSNVIKHSRASTVQIRLRTSEHGVLLMVEDDGVGFTPTTPSKLLDQRHLGLRGMQERVEMAGGRWDVRSAPGEGTRLTAVVPFP